MQLFKKNSKQTQKDFISFLSIDKSDWFQVFSACLGKSIVVQSACSELVVKGRNWNVDFSDGIIMFGNDKYDVQFIGSESSSSNSWMWGWENINGFSDGIIELANKIKHTGDLWGLEAFTTAEFQIDNVYNGHNLAMVACAINDGYCYYRGPHAGGAILVGFIVEDERVFKPIDALKFISITSECVQNYHVDHRIFVEGLLTWNNTEFEWHDKTLVAHFKKDVEVIFEEVEEFWRITNLKAK